ncbi:helix-turn-helix domain-containing protein [Sporosarcina limicola]|uniref:Transcriptional regulator with XRE-family HTH domain n=1 Tax=Sporosarcina limicola TaxID=34101 RepID=A0A927MLA9_9BACL|nr:cupin domain-containing protein [Sporosarcina limicola]MBE1556703.1 transcriptional regulator with XRE-family HTH domain [Sporosarcina limicola]
MNDKIGDSIKELRLNKRMTLSEVSKKSGLSISFLSQVERFKSSVTLTSLKKISEALDVNLSYFFHTNVDQSPSITRNKEREEHNYQDMNFKFSNLLGNFQNPVFEPIIATLLPGEKQRKPYSHKGQEFLYVLEGTLTVILDDNEHLLHLGDSLHIDSTTPHTWFNASEKPAKLLIVATLAEGGMMNRFH